MCFSWRSIAKTACRYRVSLGSNIRTVGAFREIQEALAALRRAESFQGPLKSQSVFAIFCCTHKLKKYSSDSSVQKDPGWAERTGLFPKDGVSELLAAGVCDD